MSKNNGLCKYKDIFGAPGTGLHSYRIFGIAAVDLGLTVLFGLILGQITGWRWTSLIVPILASVPIHWLFCVDTAVLKKVMKSI